MNTQSKPSISQIQKSNEITEGKQDPSVEKNHCIVPTCKWRYQKCKKNKRYYKAKVVSLPTALQNHQHLYSRLTGSVIRYTVFKQTLCVHYNLSEWLTPSLSHTRGITNTLNPFRRAAAGIISSTVR